MIILIMGVSGSGKSTIDRRLAMALTWTFVDADAFHPPANVDKMRQAIALTDADRHSWLLALREEIVSWLRDGRQVVLACSALKAAYRRLLLIDPSHMKLVYLKGSFDLFRKRLSRRPRHFMPEELLASQCEILEEPPDALMIDAEDPPEAIVQRIRSSLMV